MLHLLFLGRCMLLAYKEVQHTVCPVVQAWQLTTDYIFQKTRGKIGA